jgi:hypothetical protein
MRLMALCHTEVVEELVALRAAVSSTVESTLGRSLDKTFRVEAMGELIAEFQRLEEQHSWLQWPTTRICDLLLGLLASWAQLADCLDKAVRQLGVELATRWEADAELEAM